MTNVTNSQWMRHCFHHFLHSFWRKKTIVLAIIMVSTFIVLALQYNSVNKDNRNTSNNNNNNYNNKVNSNKMQDNEHLSMLPRRNLSAVESRFHSNSIEFSSTLSPQSSSPSSSSILSSPSAAAALRKNQIDFDQYNAKSIYSHNQNLNEKLLRDEPYAIEMKLQGPRPKFNQNNLLKDEEEGKKFKIDQNSNVNRLTNSNNNNNKNEIEQKGYVPAFRIVHLDLKGAPPKVSYFKQIFPLIKEAGANGLLIEYEDMFPFWGYLKEIPAGNAYSKEDIDAILTLAKLYDFEVIPLVQTFGHLEMALKLKQFRSLREVDTFPMALCPQKNDSFTLVTNMIDQILITHPTIKYLHIGCDEVFHMGYCDKCRRIDRDTIYINHVKRVASYVKEKYNLRVIIWDDMLRNLSPDKLKESRLGELVEPMVWTYVRDVYRFIPYSTWSMFADVFPYIWAGSAFKGAFGETLTVPNVKMHLENHEAWLEVMKEQSPSFSSFRGIVLTGWQRYDHLATLCELLPAGLPSLIVNLLTLKTGYFNRTSVFKNFDKILKCPSNSHYYTSYSLYQVDLETDSNLWQRASSCQFPGSHVFRLTMELSDTIKRVNDYIYDVTVHKAWLTDYNVRRNYSNPFRIDEGLQEHSNVYYRLTDLIKEAQIALKMVYDEYTVAEWIEQNIYPYIQKLELLMKNSIQLKKIKEWQRRPLPPLKDLERFGIGVHDNTRSTSASFH